MILVVILTSLTFPVFAGSNIKDSTTKKDSLPIQATDDSYFNTGNKSVVYNTKYYPLPDNKARNMAKKANNRADHLAADRDEVHRQIRNNRECLRTARAERITLGEKITTLFEWANKTELRISKLEKWGIWSGSIIGLISLISLLVAIFKKR